MSGAVERANAIIDDEFAPHGPKALLRELVAEIGRLKNQLLLADHPEYTDNVCRNENRLVRELDVIWNGEEGAAQQASLCDMVSQIRKELPELQSERNRCKAALEKAVNALAKIALEPAFVAEACPGVQRTRYVVGSDVKDDALQAAMEAKAVLAGCSTEQGKPAT